VRAILSILLVFILPCYANTLPIQAQAKFFTQVLPPVVASSDTVLVTSQDTTGTLRNDVDGKVGFQFTVGANPITVTALGRWVVSGNSGAHNLVIMTGDCSSTLAAVIVNTSGATPGTYLYATITPLTLSANASYRVLSTETSAGTEQWYSNGPITTTSDVGSISAAYSIAGPGCGNAAANESYVPVNLKYHL
jgi:hypothetical protein